MEIGSFIDFIASFFGKIFTGYSKLEDSFERDYLILY